jgi:hypothetical protein
MDEPQLVKYIKENLKRGCSLSSIKNILLKHNYSEDQVLNAFNYIENDKLKNKINIKKFLMFTIPIFILTIVIFIFLNFNTNTISENNIVEGTYFNLKENEKINFKLENEKHSIILNLINENSVSLTIMSEPIYIEININEEKKINLNNDFFFDLSIILNNIDNGIPDFFIKKINELMCDEDWNCTAWSNCTYENIQNRSCEDLNECGSTFNKPKLSLECTCIEDWNCTTWGICSKDGNQARNCTDLNDCRNLDNMPVILRECDYCEENWNCTEWSNCTENGNQTRICTDLNDCNSTENKPILIQDCEYIEPCNPFWTCDDWSDCDEDGYQFMTCTDLNYCDLNNYTINYTIECDCEENWSCTAWSNCTVDGNQSRTCTDLNNCNSTENKPDLVKNCVYCTEDWVCGNWSNCTVDGNQTRTCTDVNDCGSTENKPDLVQDCEYIVTLDLICDDIEYLITELSGEYYGQFRINHSRNNLSFVHTGSNSIYPLYYKFFLNDSLLEENLVPTWPEGEFSTYFIVQNTNDDVLEPGQYHLKAIIDSVNNFQEIDKENNICEKTITIN